MKVIFSLLTAFLLWSPVYSQLHRLDTTIVGDQFTQSSTHYYSGPCFKILFDQMYDRDIFVFYDIDWLCWSQRLAGRAICPVASPTERRGSFEDELRIRLQSLRESFYHSIVPIPRCMWLLLSSVFLWQSWSSA